MALILPKGIVVNSPGLSDKILQTAARPMSTDEVQKFWQVYTTTQRRLKDPTAERLENLFWRIWGSKQRQLSSIVVAQMFANISKGNTHPAIQPLKSPVARDESGVPARKIARLDSGDLITIRNKPQTTHSSLRPPKSSLGSKNSQARTTPAQARNGIPSNAQQQWPSSAMASQSTQIAPGGYSPSPLSSSAKVSVPMPPPILKKTRGQSSTGPKPTARFISPGISEDEDAEEGNADTGESEESPNSHVTVRPPTPPQGGPAVRAAPSPRKKLYGQVKPVIGRKKRPTIGRRPSSQSSTGSENSIHQVLESELTEDIPASGGGSFQDSKTSVDVGIEQGKAKGQENVRAALENKHVTKTTSRSRAVRPRPGRSNSGRTPITVAPGVKGKERVVENSDDSGSTSKLHTIENQHDGAIDENELQRDQTEELKLQEYLLEQGRKALEAKKAAEDEELEEQSRKLSSKSKRSMSAHSLSAAYRGIKRSGTDNAPKAVAEIGVFDTATDGASDGFGKASTTNGSIKGRDGDSAGEAQVTPLRKRSLISEASATASFSASPDVVSSLGYTMTSRSVSNLTALLQKDDEKLKAKGKEKERKHSTEQRRQ